MKKLALLIVMICLTIVICLFTILSCSVEPSPADQTPISDQVTSVVQKVMWNLSGAVMPKPQYGSRDISGSERTSTLTVYQTDTQIQITGDMSGLRKNTSYTVFLARGYIPNTNYSGLFTNNIGPFTFTSDETGACRWTFIIFNNDFPGFGTYTLSIWINETVSKEIILISDNFDVSIK